MQIFQINNAELYVKIVDGKIVDIRNLLDKNDTAIAVDTFPECCALTFLLNPLGDAPINGTIDIDGRKQ